MGSHWRDGRGPAFPGARADRVADRLARDTLPRVPLLGPPPLSFNPLRRLSGDLLTERRVEVPFPPGEMAFSIRRTRAFATYPLPLLLDAYERFGPVFTLPVLHDLSVV